jgi:hypothetical protein
MIDSIHVLLGGLVLQQRVGIPMGSNIIMSYPLFKVRYQWNPDRNHKICNIIYSMCRCSWNVATDKWKVHNGEIEIISFVGKGRS